MKAIITASVSGPGGTEHAAFRLSKLLSGHGHGVIPASSDGPLVIGIEKIDTGWYNTDFYSGKLSYSKGMTAYVKMPKTEKPGIIHYQIARVVPAYAVATEVASPKTKMFHHTCGLDPKAYPKIAKSFDRLGVHIIGNCKHEREKLIRYGFPAEHVAYTYSALPEQHDNSDRTPRDEVTLDTLSRLDFARAVSLVIDFLEVLLNRDLPVRPSAASIDEESDNLEAQAERLGLTDKVIFPGGACDLSAYSREVDILLSTPVSTSDHGAGVGNNILEAGLYETPVVTCNVANVFEMVTDGRAGYCVPPKDKERSANAVTSLVRNLGLRRQMGKALHDHATALCFDDEVYRATMAAYKT